MSEEGSSDAGGLLVNDLRPSLDELASLLTQACDAADPTDAFLLAAGASQILRDAVEDDPGRVLRANDVLRSHYPRRLGGPLSRGADALSGALHRARRARGRRRALATVADRVDAAVDLVAGLVYEGHFDAPARAMLTSAVLEASGLEGPASSANIRLPSSFRSFDQHPRDLTRLARKIRERIPASSRFVVVGVRTSGSYLAPLLAHSLRIAGAGDTSWCTVRPQRPPAPSIRAALRASLSGGAHALVIDDPPTTGRSLELVGARLEAIGFPATSVTLALAVHEGGTLTSSLDRYGAVLLEWGEWDIHRRLSGEVVRSGLQSLLGSDAVVEEFTDRQLDDEPSALRGHARAGFNATVARGSTRTSHVLVAEGSGLGFFGRHEEAVARALPGRTPHVFGFRDGITFRQWLPSSARVAIDRSERAAAAVQYVNERRLVLPARRDAARGMAGQQPAWEVASRLLAAPYGAAGLPMRSAGLDAAIRDRLSPAHPSVVDGQTGATSWFESDDSLVKVSFAERAFSNLDLACYDAVYDVAGIAAESVDELDRVARAEYELAAGAPIDHERWLLYRLVHLWDLGRLGQRAPDVIEAAMARAWQDWARARLLGTSVDHGTGAWCAIDIDGVLETSRLGAPTMTPSAASGLRALDAHGYRILLATGRSLSEVQDRCSRYGMVGGVAEYGGVIYEHQSKVSRQLVDDDGRAALAACRAYLARVDGVRVAERHEVSVRAYRVTNDARARIDEATVAAALAASNGGLRAHRGIAQVDFVPVSVDKATGLAALLESLGSSDRAPDVAIGDSDADLAMLRAAGRGFVPRHGRALAGGTVRAMRHSHQRGLLDAVTQVLGHAPSGCARCRDVVERDDCAELLSSVLRGVEGGRVRGLAHVWPITARSRKLAGPATTQPD